MSIRCSCGKDNPPENQYCGACGHSLKTVDVEPDLAAKIQSIVEKELHHWSKDKEAVGLDIAANAFKKTRSWLIASFTIVGLAFAFFGWSFHSFIEESRGSVEKIVEETKKKVQKHETEIKKLKNDVIKEKNTIINEIEEVRSKLQDPNINIILTQLRELRQQIDSYNKQVDNIAEMEGKAVSLASALETKLESSEPLTEQKQVEIQENINAYNRYLYSLNLSLVKQLQIRIIDKPVSRKSMPGIKFALIEEDRKTVRVAKIAADLLDPVLSDLTKCNLLRMGRSKSEIEKMIQPAGLKEYIEELNIVAGLAYYFTCSFNDSPVFKWGINTRMKIDKLPSDTNGLQHGGISSSGRERAWSAFFWKLREAMNKKNADGLLARTWVQLSSEQNNILSSQLFTSQLSTIAETYNQGKYAATVDQLIAQMNKPAM